MKIIDKIKKTVRFNLRLFLVTHKIPLIMRIPYLQYFEIESLDRDTPVRINLPTKPLNYEVYESEKQYFLYNTKGNNDAIFLILDIKNKESFVSKIVGYNCRGGFPEVESKEDLLKVIIALDEECVKKFGDENAISSDFKVTELSMLPRKKKHYQLDFNIH